MKPERSHLTKQTTLDEYLSCWDRRIQQHPERTRPYREQQDYIRNELSPHLQNGEELWHYFIAYADSSDCDPGIAISGAVGLAVVVAGEIRHWIWLGATL